ncbi:RNA polymerase sigma-70 factor [Mucilaginibacter sp. KACC 22063]|uniref:RNA polymerase sigma-70 factor n=1 Tax=Mucilaginibacter sp. KACC 22063 TaxID=3025666 RepID=UPI0023652207|nr:RNA polymerase sigma-70 factor [Mucilaginibacter sp. KACC 22063]WDF54423.1 RNA polymerase sigma-70 factor [Mucilaginibacter sp. KACC 22063]
MDMLRKDELEAFRHIYNQYWKKLYSEAYKRLKDTDLAEEAVQDVFANFWLKRHQINITSTIGGYLNNSLTYLVIDLYRKESVRQKYAERFKTGHTEIDNTTEHEIAYRELTYNIDSQINLLPEKCRSVFELSRKQYKTNKEISAQLSISEKTVENHLTNAIKRLRHGLSHYLVILVVLVLK